MSPTDRVMIADTQWILHAFGISWAGIRGTTLKVD
jgi:hypothetical protein